jgi:hypothetical protein
MNYSEEDIQQDMAKIYLLNEEQRNVYEAVTGSVLGDDSNREKLFFLDGPGGSGKTFTYSAIISKLRSMKKIVLVVASSGIAACLLAGGRTAHSRFKIPIKLDSLSTCNVSANSKLANLIRNTALILYDEAAMTACMAYEALDRTFRDIMNVDLPFGGITCLFGGDFRQILPVVIHGNRAAIVNASLKASFLWPMFKKFKLTINRTRMILLNTY